MNSINPPLGICITYSSHVLLSILSDGRLVMKPLDVGGPEEMLFNDTLDSMRNDTSLLNKSNLAISLNEVRNVNMIDTLLFKALVLILFAILDAESSIQ